MSETLPLPMALLAILASAQIQTILQSTDGKISHESTFGFQYEFHLCFAQSFDVTVKASWRGA